MCIQHSGTDSAFKHGDWTVDKIFLQRIQFLITQTFHRTWKKPAFLQQFAQIIASAPFVCRTGFIEKFLIQFMQSRKHLKQGTTAIHICTESSRISERYLAFTRQWRCGKITSFRRRPVTFAGKRIFNTRFCCCNFF